MILPDSFWSYFGHQLVVDFDPVNINPCSYEVHLGTEIVLQVFHGREFPDTKAHLTEDGMLLFLDPVTREKVSCFARFNRGDCFLAHTVEYFQLGRFITMQYLDKSSTGREGLSHRHAGHIDPGFSGQLTLEYDVQRTGYLRPYMPIGQVIASLTLGVSKPYHIRKSSKYVGQTGATRSKNRKLAFENIFDHDAVEAI